MQPEYRFATAADLNELVETRIKVLRAANQLPDSVDMTDVAIASRRYYEKSFADGSHIAYLVVGGADIIGAGGVSFYQVLPTFHNPSGMKAYIMNMYTAPEHRRKGIGLKTLDLLVGACQSRGITFITLEATGMGKPLYEKYGFVGLADEMYLPERSHKKAQRTDDE